LIPRLRKQPGFKENSSAVAFAADRVGEEAEADEADDAA
jgi:hypothetical protein